MSTSFSIPPRNHFALIMDANFTNKLRQAIDPSQSQILIERHVISQPAGNTNTPKHYSINYYLKAASTQEVIGVISATPSTNYNTPDIVSFEQHGLCPVALKFTVDQLLASAIPAYAQQTSLF